MGGDGGRGFVTKNSEKSFPILLQSAAGCVSLAVAAKHLESFRIDVINIRILRVGMSVDVMQSGALPTYIEG
jgi:hypothetical protein